MRTILALLLLTSTCHARLGVEVSLAIARARIAAQHSVVTKPKLYFYTAVGCEPCRVAKREIPTDKETWSYIQKHFDWTVINNRPGTKVPSFAVEGGDLHTGWRSPQHFLKWLKTQPTRRVR